MEIHRTRRISGGAAVRCIRWFAGVPYGKDDAKRRIANMSGESCDETNEVVGGPLDGQPIDVDARSHMICITQHGCHIYRLVDGRYAHERECSQRGKPAGLSPTDAK